MTQLLRMLILFKPLVTLYVCSQKYNVSLQGKSYSIMKKFALSKTRGFANTMIKIWSF